MKTIFLIIFIFMPIQSFACIVKALPDLKNIEGYSAIFTGEVTGIHVTEYEKLRLEALKEGKKHDRWFADITLEHEITVIVNKVIKGKAPQVIKLKARGCAIHIPQMNMDGVFFIKPNGQTIPIYAVEGQYYSEILLKLGRYTANKRLNKDNLLNGPKAAH